MTWHTSVGDRALRGAEADVVREVLDVIVDRISENLTNPHEEPLWDFGVSLFDELTTTQQLTVMKQVAEHLLTETPETLSLTAVTEAAAYAIFHTLATSIEIEIDSEHLAESEEWESEWVTYWRSMTLAAYKQSVAEEELEWGEGVVDDEFPDVNSRDVEHWHSLVERLADRILWDRDFEMLEFYDAAPEEAQAMKQMLGIETDYYTAVAEDVRDEQIQATLHAVRALARTKPR